VEVEPSRWDELLARLGVTDVYYSRGFAEASAPLADGQAVFLHLAGEEGDVLFPCIARRSPADVVSPYGYGGPLAVGARPPLDAFPAAYEAWCRQRGMLSSFVVFHPLFGNGAAADRLGFRANELAGTIAWPLGGDDLLAGMHKHHRRVVRRAVAQGCEISVEPAPADLGGFVEIYEETMRRAEAAPFYFFPGAYWDALVRDVPLVRVGVHRDGEPLAGVLGMGARPWLHYHLGGSTDAGHGTGAMHLALYGLATWGREQGYETLHLGGGVGGRADSLFEFKLRFSPRGRTGVSIGKAVHDPAGYLALAGSDAIDWDGFFPAYRAPS
jgi:serine/alanine adding enzyme